MFWRSGAICLYGEVDGISMQNILLKTKRSDLALPLTLSYDYCIPKRAHIHVLIPLNI